MSGRERACARARVCANWGVPRRGPSPAPVWVGDQFDVPAPYRRSVGVRQRDRSAVRRIPHVRAPLSRARVSGVGIPEEPVAAVTACERDLRRVSVHAAILRRRYREVREAVPPIARQSPRDVRPAKPGEDCERFRRGSGSALRGSARVRVRGGGEAQRVNRIVREAMVEGVLPVDIEHT